MTKGRLILKNHPVINRSRHFHVVGEALDQLVDPASRVVVINHAAFDITFAAHAKRLGQRVQFDAIAKPSLLDHRVVDAFAVT